ncbi:MAG: hypothetical protein WA963_01920 [Bermanella sp.]
MTKGKILELTAEGAEIALKQAVDSSVLSEVPIVGSIVKLYSIGSSIRDNLYTQKVRQFLVAINEIPEEKQLEFREAVISSSEESEKLVQKILLVIESQSDIEKSDLIANLFLAYLDGVIDGAGFRRSLDVTAAYFLDDLFQFLKGDGFHGFMCEKYEDLERRGLASLVGSPLIAFDNTTSDELRRDGWQEGADAVLFKSTSFGSNFQKAYHYGARLRKKSETSG